MMSITRRMQNLSFVIYAEKFSVRLLSAFYILVPYRAYLRLDILVRLLFSSHLGLLLYYIALGTWKYECDSVYFSVEYSELETQVTIVYSILSTSISLIFNWATYSSTYHFVGYFLRKFSLLRILPRFHGQQNRV